MTVYDTLDWKSYQTPDRRPRNMLKKFTQKFFANEIFAYVRALDHMAHVGNGNNTIKYGP